MDTCSVAIQIQPQPDMDDIMPRISWNRLVEGSNEQVFVVIFFVFDNVMGSAKKKNRMAARHGRIYRWSMFVYQIARLQGHPVTQSRALVMFSIQLSNIWESNFLIFSWTMIFQLNDMEFPLPLVHNKHPHPESSPTDFWVCVPQIKHKPNYDTIHRQIIDPSNKNYTYILGISIYIWHIYIYKSSFIICI